MPTYAVIRERGTGWDPARPVREQDAWDEHAAFMDGLVEDGFIVVGGPLDDVHRVLLIVEAADPAEVGSRFDADPWTPIRILRVASIERWDVLLGSLPSSVRPR